MTISENLIELNKIKDGIKTTVNKFGGNCAEDFTEYRLNIERVMIEGPIRDGETLELNISEGVQKIKDYAFYKNALISAVTIPNTVHIIGNQAF